MLCPMLVGLSEEEQKALHSRRILSFHSARAHAELRSEKEEPAAILLAWRLGAYASSASFSNVCEKRT